MTTEKKDLVHLAKPLAESAVAPGECESVPDELALAQLGEFAGQVGQAHLAALVDELRPDAERFRFLVNQDIENDFPRAGLFIGQIPDNCALTGPEAIAEIDKAMQAPGMQPPNNQPNSDHVAVIGAKPDSVHLAKPIETATDTSLAPYDWKHWGGGACPVPMGTRVCIRFRDNSVFNNCDSAGIGWDHIGSSNGDIVAYRVESFAAESGISSQDRRPNEQKDVVGEGK